MKRYYIASAVIAAVNTAIYPLMMTLAYRERGYHAHGGETLLMICGFVLAAAVLHEGYVKINRERATNPTGDASPETEDTSVLEEIKSSLPEGKPLLTESEQSGCDHFDATTIYHDFFNTVN